eukprot:CAMPEP_0179428790 /NCGR_PEP_ID=MMETSP0799-20121207/14366_1 /TAXON_ID=46947 /ORGANISM="Geminigera cryophila, Strain CCMP2564" /LENGTH=92 /DNA_ID=CAMNT_0021204445 /DNA_START=686 /DNA_END=964 /DNA_ORIENTATION=-
MFALLSLLGWNWSHDHNNGMDGNNNSCGTMDHTATTGGDESCLGGLSQHNRYGFMSPDMAYTSSSSYDMAKRDYTGIWGSGGSESEGGFNQY